MESKPRGGKRVGAGRKPKSDKDILITSEIKEESNEKSNTAEEAQTTEVSPVTVKDTFPSKVHAFKKGQVANPAGRKAAGAFIKEWINSFGEKNLTRCELDDIAKDESQPWTRRAAALRIIRTMEMGSLAALEPAITGKKTLQELEQDGVNVECVKSFKIKTKPGEFGDEVERAIEIYDRSGADFDRIMDRTEGKPTQAVKIDGNLRFRTPTEGATAANTLIVILTKSLGIAIGVAAGGGGPGAGVSDRGGGAEGEPETVGASGGVLPPA